MADNLSFQHWFKAYKKLKGKRKDGVAYKNAKIDETSRNAYWKWRAAKGAPVYGSPQNPKDIAGDTPVPPPAYDPNAYRDTEYLDAERDLNTQLNQDQAALDEEHRNFLIETFGSAFVNKEGTGRPALKIQKNADGTYDDAQIEQFGGQFADMREMRDQGYKDTLNSSAQRGMLRSGNNTVQRKRTTDQYQQNTLDALRGHTNRSTTYNRRYSDNLKNHSNSTQKLQNSAQDRARRRYNERWGIS